MTSGQTDSTPDDAPLGAGLRDLRSVGADWSGVRVLVAGIGASGFAAADALLEHGADVVVVDERDREREQERATILDTLGATVRLGEGGADPEGIAAWAGKPGALPDLVVASPGWRPSTPLLAAAAAAKVPIWSEIELAWRMRTSSGQGVAGVAAPWLTIAGTSGVGSTASLLTAILAAAGTRAVTVGTPNVPVLEALRHPDPYHVLVVAISSAQLHWTSSLRPQASVVLNAAPAHVDWHGSPGAYAADLARAYHDTELACVYNVQDPATERMVEQADVIEGARAIGFTLGVPSVSMVGLVDDVLADRAFVAERKTSAAELATLDDVAQWVGGPPGGHQVANALAAAALARAHGVSADAVRAGLRSAPLLLHQLSRLGESSGVSWVNDAAAATLHAAEAALQTISPAVWIASGAAPDGDFGRLVARRAQGLRVVVLIGPHREVLAEAVTRHAPQVIVLSVDVNETDSVQASRRLMETAVGRAAEVARRGDVVLFSPGVAPGEPFASSEHRGDAFAAAVRALPGYSEARL